MDADFLGQIPLEQITGVTFYKRDELTSDLICCDIVVAGKTWTIHEEVPGWPLLIEHLERLAGFRADWFEAVALPPFGRNETIAFRRL
ncbi:MAG: hypothetical protein KDE55_00790 [Novosphingobium sp.]|nr:hypothetical protein [Novosphingobium sp.]